MDEEKLAPSPNPSRAFTEAEIVVLDGIQAIRKRPGMYIGSADAMGLRVMLLDLVDLAVECASGGLGRSVSVEIHDDRSVTVRADGAGFPVGEISALEPDMTTVYGCSGRWRYGLAAFNALSESAEARLRRDGILWRQRFAKGKAASPVESLGPTREAGASLTFRADPEIFGESAFEAAPIAARLGELAALNPEVRFEFRDDRTGLADSWERRAGLVDLVREINRGREPIHEPIAFKGRCGKAELGVAFQYHGGYETDLRAFANLTRMDEMLTNDARPVRNGRSRHVIGFLRALRQSIRPSTGWRSPPVPKEHLLDGLTAVLSIRLDEPMFEGSCRSRLGNPEAEAVAFSVAFLRLSAYFDEHPEVARRLREKISAEV